MAFRRVMSEEAVHFHSTPQLVAERMGTLLAEMAGNSKPKIRLLDPGIGDGALSAAAVAAFRDLNVEAEVNGVDLATDLIDAATQRLNEAGATFNLRKSDFLRGQTLSGFDAIICNPPYGKRSQPELGNAILAEYKEAISGHPNLFALFIHKIIRALRDGGVAVVICPRSLLSGPYFKSLRRFINEQGSLEHLLLFDQRFGLFDGVLQGVCIFGFRKGAPQRATVIHRIIGPLDEDQWTVDDIFATGERLSYRLIPGSSEENRRLLENALRHPVSIGDVFSVETGPVVWFRHKDRLTPADERTENPLPVIWSDQIEDGYIGTGRKSDRLRLVLHNRFALSQSKIGPALVTKRITAPEEKRRLVTALTPSALWKVPVVYENHTNVLRSKSGSLDELVHLALLLATDLFDDLLRALSHNTQVGAADLRLLPYIELPMSEEERSAVLSSAEESVPLSSLLDLSGINERFLQVLSTADFSYPHVRPRSDVVHLTLPLSEPEGSAVGSREPVDH